MTEQEAEQTAEQMAGKSTEQAADEQSHPDSPVVPRICELNDY